MRYDAAYSVLAVLGLAMVLAFSCSCADDDDDGVVCDYGQGSWGNGDLRTPVQECVMGGTAMVTCLEDLEDEEIAWVCACRPERCEATKRFFAMRGGA